MNQPPKKILLVMPLSTTNWGSSNAGGVDSVCQMMAQFISENINPEFHYRIVAIEQLSEPKEFDKVIKLASNVELVWIPRCKKLNDKLTVPSLFYYAYKVGQQANDYSPEVIHTHLWGTLLATSRRIKSVVTVHSYKKIGRRSVSALNDFLYVTMLPSLCNLFGHKIVCVGEQLQRAVSAETSQSVISIDNPICSEFFSTSTKKVMSDTLHLVTCALLTPKKQIEKTIFLTSALIKQGINCKLDVIGPESDAAYSAALKTLIQKENIEQSVTFLGRLNKTQIISCYQQSDIGLFFSKEETFGLVPLEMLATGLPIISTRVGVLAENEQYFIDVGTVFVDVHNDDFTNNAAKLINNMKSVNVNSLKEKYAVSHVAAQYEDVYRELIKGV
jgi:glycosyltransferase involved in cell wall biosynthesis